MGVFGFRVQGLGVYTQTHTDTHRHTQTHTDTHRHTQTHTTPPILGPSDPGVEGTLHRRGIAGEGGGRGSEQVITQ